MRHVDQTFFFKVSAVSANLGIILPIPIPIPILSKMADTDTDTDSISTALIYGLRKSEVAKTAAKIHT